MAVLHAVNNVLIISGVKVLTTYTPEITVFLYIVCKIQVVYKMRYVVSIVLFWLCFMSGGSGARPLCDVQSGVEDTVYTIDLDHLVQGAHPPLDEIFSHYSYVIDKYGSHFNEIPEWGYMMVTPVNDFLIFNLSGTVELYDRNGNFLRRIGRNGMDYKRGDFFSDHLRGSADSSHIYIFDDAHSVIQKYTYGGKYLGCIKVMSIDIHKHPEKKNLLKGVICDGMVSLKDSYILLHYAYWSGDIPYNYVILNKRGNVVSSLRTMGKYDGVNNGTIMEMTCYHYRNMLYVKDLSDTLYMVRDNKFIPKYYFKQHNSLSNLTDSLGGKIDIFKVKRPLCIISSIQETDRYLFFSIYRFPPMSIFTYCYYDKMSHTAYKMFDGWHIPADKLQGQRDSTDYIYVNCLVNPVINNIVEGGGKYGRMWLYIK